MISRPLTSSSSLLRALSLLIVLLLATGTSTAEVRRWARRSPEDRMRRRTSSWVTNVTLLGDASFKNNAISLTRGTPGSVGRALRSVRFLDPTTGDPASFSSRFSFSIRPSRPPIFGDGFAFLITSDPKSLGSPDGYMGLFPNDSATSHTTQRKGRRSGDGVATIAVEFDTNLDAALRDINDNHVAFDVGSIFSSASADAGNAGVDLKGSVPMTAWVEYNSSETMLRAWLSYSRFRPPDPLLVANVDLSGLYREFMHVGFSASGRRGGAALYLVRRWSFRTFGFSSPSSGSSTAATASGGCQTCSPQVDGTVHQEVSGAAARPNKQRKRNMEVGLGVAGAFVALFLMIAASSYQNRSRREGSSERAPQPAEGNPMPDASARISLDVLRSATKKFDCSKIIGQGGYGTVYEGLLPSGCKVAVKRFGPIKRMSLELATEVMAILPSSGHQNLAPPKGWCWEKDELLLVYEYMPNGSLDKVLHPAPPPPTAAAAEVPAAVTLPWDKRLRIVVGLATALAYLHDKCAKTIIHRDVKPSNVLLDEDFNAKLGDFMLAVVNGPDRTLRSNVPAGTMGYLAPESVHSAVATEKSDAYSFGVVALEVATGRLPLEKRVALVDWVWGLWGQGRLVEAADPRLGGGFNRDEMVRMLRVGLSCAHPDCSQRPAMRKAIRMLNGETPTPVLPARKPAIPPLFPMPEDSQETTGASSPASVDTTTHWSTPCTSFS